MQRDRQGWIKHARELRAAGVALEIPQDDWRDPIPQSGLIIRQCDGPIENNLFNMPSGWTGCRVSLRLTIDTSGFAIAAYDLEVPWQANFNFLEDPRRRSKEEVYEFPNGDEYPRDVVINHYADIQRILRPGQTIGGLLLAWSFEPIPRFVDGTEIPAMVNVFDQSGHCYPKAINLWADRSLRLLTRKKKKKARNRTPIFEESEVGDLY